MHEVLVIRVSSIKSALSIPLVSTFAIVKVCGEHLHRGVDFVRRTAQFSNTVYVCGGLNLTGLQETKHKRKIMPGEERTWLCTMKIPTSPTSAAGPYWIYYMHAAGCSCSPYTLALAI